MRNQRTYRDEQQQQSDTMDQLAIAGYFVKSFLKYRLELKAEQYLCAENKKARFIQGCLKSAIEGFFHAITNFHGPAEFQ